MKSTRDLSRSSKLSSSLIGIATLLALSGCNISTISSRSKEKAEAFAAASPEQKSIIQEGWLNYGFTPDMVYIALGKPDRVSTKPDGTTIWTYLNFAANMSNAALGGTKIIATQNGRPVTDARNRIDFSTRPDVGSTPPAEEMPELLIHFYNGKTLRIQFKRQPQWQSAET